MPGYPEELAICPVPGKEPPPFIHGKDAENPGRLIVDSDVSSLATFSAPFGPKSMPTANSKFELSRTRKPMPCISRVSDLWVKSPLKLIRIAGNPLSDVSEPVSYVKFVHFMRNGIIPIRAASSQSGSICDKSK